MKGQHSKASLGNILKSISGLIVSIICVVVIFFIIKIKKIRTKKSNQLLLNLCVGHLFTGIAHFYGIFTLQPVGKYVNSGHIYSTFALVFLSIDRFIFIRHPFRYNTVKAYHRVHIGFMLSSPLIYIILSLIHI